MFKISFVLAVALLATSSLGCSVDECDKHAERPQCQPTPPDVGTGGILTISPRRINIKGDTVVVTPSAKTTPADEVKITQPGMAEVSLGKLGSGSVKVPALTSSQFSLGKAYLVIGTNLPEPIRFYLPPSYSQPSVNISTGAEVSLWAGVSMNGKIVSLNNSMLAPPPVYLGEYSYQSKQLRFNGGYNYPATAKGSSSSTRKFVGYVNPYDNNNIMLRSCILGSDTCDGIQTGSGSLLDLTVNRNATLLGAILDSKIEAYFIDATFGNATSHLANSMIMTPRLLATEDLDGDTLSDFLVWNGSTASVLRQTKSGGTIAFNLDKSLSAVISAAMGKDKPTALFVADVDGDELQDIIYTTTNQVVWLANAPDSAMKFTRGVPVGLTGSVDSLSVGDVDLDSRPDIVVASKSDNAIKVLINQATY